MRTTKAQTSLCLISAFVVHCLDSITPSYIWNFKTVAILCFWAGWFESFLFENPKDRFSRDEAHIIAIHYMGREFGISRLCEQRRFGRASASTQSRQNLRCSLIQAVSPDEPPDRKPDPWPLWMAGHAQLKICRNARRHKFAWRCPFKPSNSSILFE